MKKFLLIIFINLFWNNVSFSENIFDYIGPPKEIEGICSYKKIYERQKPCDSLYELRDTINSIFFDLIPRPSNVFLKVITNTLLLSCNSYKFF